MNSEALLPLLASAVLILPSTGLARDRYAAARADMVAGIRKDIRASARAADDDHLERALAAVGRTPREKFVPKAARTAAYLSTPLSIGFEQTISAAYIVTIMTAAVQLPENATVLDVGTGSGYQAAVLSLLAARVSSIEIVEPLAKSAAKRLSRLGYHNVTVRAGDGYAGWADRAPFDAIIVAAGAATIPQPLIDQLKPGGRLVMPIGPAWTQEQLIVVTKSIDGTMARCSLGWVMFVPFTGSGERLKHSTGLVDRTIPDCFEAPIS